MGKPTVSTVLVLWMVFAWMITMPVTAEEVKKSPGPLVEMSLSPSRIDWHSADPAVKVQRWVLTLAGPDEIFLRREFKAGKAPFLSVFDSEGDRLPDGSYTWELKATSQGSADPRRESGSFSIQDGSFVEAPQGTGSAPKPPLVSTTAEDSIETGNLVVQRNACIGDKCSTTDANFSALKLKSVQPNILFDDIAVPEGGGTSSHDWALFANFNDVDQFSIVDFSNALFPFSIAAGAPDNSLFIAGDGKVGLGTASPAERFHLFEDVDANTILLVENPNTGLNAAGVLRAKSDSAIVNFEAHGSGRTLSRFGQPLASWAEFLQVTGNGLIMGTLADKPLILGTNNANRLHITATGNVGIGTASPGNKLHVVCNGAGETCVKVGNTSATGFSGFELTDETGTTLANIAHDNSGNTLRFNVINSEPMVFLTNSTERIRFPAPGGNVITAVNGAFLSAGGTWTNASSRESKRDIVELSGSDALKTLYELNPVTFRYKEEPDEQYVGFIAEDLPDLVATKDHKHLSPTDVVAVLTKVVKDQQKTIDELSARLADMEALLASLRPQE